MTTDAPAKAPVLVGVDGSESSLTAVDLAVQEAKRHGRPLRVVHAFIWPLLGVYLGPLPDGPPDGGLAADADRVVAEALGRVKVTAPDLAVTGEVITGAVVPVLLAEAERAGLVVLGHRGLGGFAGLLIGSVAIQIASHVSVPLLVARGTPRGQGPVVVGVDGSEAARPALEFAFAEAAARGADLVALTAWRGRVPPGTEEKLPLIYTAEDVTAERGRQLAGWIGGVRQRYPAVAVRPEVHQARAAPALVEASREAQLVVVGARGRGGFTGLLLGSVSQAVLHHAHCPVAIVRG